MPKSIDVQINETKNKIKKLQIKLKSLNEKKANLIFNKVKKANKTAIAECIKNGLSVEESIIKLNQ